MMGKHVRIFENFQADSIDIYIFDSLSEAAMPGIGRLFRVVDGDTWKIVEEDDMQPMGNFLSGRGPGMPKPSLSLPMNVVEGILEWTKKAHPSMHRDDAVQDARKTRDQALGMIERIIDADLARKP